MCRQSLVEFSTDIQVVMTKPDKTYMIMTSGELLPHCFTPRDLNNEPRISNGTANNSDK